MQKAVVHKVGRLKNVGSPLQYTLGTGASSGLPHGCTEVESKNLIYLILLEAQVDKYSFSFSRLPQGALFTVLGIETSCDDTGAAVVRALSSMFSSCRCSWDKS